VGPLRAFLTSVSSLEATSWILGKFGDEFYATIQDSLEAGWNVEITWDGTTVKVITRKRPE